MVKKMLRILLAQLHQFRHGLRRLVLPRPAHKHFFRMKNLSMAGDAILFVQETRQMG